MNETRETILVLGNGFDIAHGLPTSYIDFIKFEQVIKEVVIHAYANQNVQKVCDEKKLNQGIAGLIQVYMGNVRSTACLEGNLFQQKEMWKELIENNYWILHFENSNTIGEGWIDFEAEMAVVLEKIDNLNRQMKEDEQLTYVKLYDVGLSELSDCLDSLYEDKEYSISDIISMLLEDLNKLRRALEIYLSVYVEQLPILRDSAAINGIKPTKVISFNYTKTYERTYGQDTEDIEYTYIHGIADANRNPEENDMVLGIDEYLEEQEKDENLLCIDFKKYYQRMAFFCSRDAELWTDRISKEDEAEKEAKEFVLKDGVQLEFMGLKDYTNSGKFVETYLNQQKENRNAIPKHKIIIFGHSLGVSDKYILRKLILHDNVEVVIYYHNKKAYTDMLKNLVKVIGQDELIQRTGNKSIVFKQS